jgi:predicted O-linked N-acetylglucosamine transferase (SPINDLY family)
MPETDNFRPQAQVPDISELQPKFEQGIKLHQQGRLAEAEYIYRNILQQQPQHFGALHLLGVIALQAQKPERAVELIRKAIGLNAGDAAAHNNLAKALLDLKRPEDALPSCDKAIALMPNFPMAHNNRGNALLGLRRFQDALASYDKAIELMPDFAMAYSNKGFALSNLKRYAEAIANCNKAIALEPNFAEAHNNRGDAQIGLRRLADAVASLDRAIVLKPDFAMAHKNRGKALEKLNRYDDAFAAYGSAFALDSDLPGVEGDRLGAKMRVCNWSNFDFECGRLISSVRDGKTHTAPFAFIAIPSSPADQLQCAKLWITREFPASKTQVWQGERYKHSRIRLAYLSPDFREHALSFLAAGMFEYHDKSRFDITAISCGPDDNSEIRKRLKGSFERFIDAETYDDDQIANLLKEFEIDVFVDLAGFTAGLRTSVFAKRPAPIQVNYLGYPGTTGAEYIDYIIADRIIVPESQQEFYSEKIVILPNSYQVNDARRSIADRAFTRTELGLPLMGFVFCCFNNNYKVTPRIFDCWMRILNRVEDSVLWLLEDNPKAAINLRKEAVARGVDAERLIFAKRLPLSEHLARHRVADLFLDTLPCNAHTTASDALWAGLPVLTCLGETFAGRVAASLLNAIRLPELITATLEDYEQLAVKLATHPEKLATIKRRLAENRSTTPLFDTKLFTKHIEAAYIAMYERHQAGLPPEHIFIPD